MSDASRKDARPCRYSAVQGNLYKIFPNDLNQHGTVFGGLIMAEMDRLCAIVAERHSDSVCVTAGVDAVHFLAPARRGDTLVFSASVNRTWRTSMEIGCRVEAEAIGERTRRHILSAYLSFVAIDEHGRPRPVPEVIPETEAERRRWQEAELRRSHRLQEAEALRRLRAGGDVPGRQQG